MKQTPNPSILEPDLAGIAWAQKQSQALLAVDNIQPSKAGLELSKAVMEGRITHDEAILAILERARQYTQP